MDNNTMARYLIAQFCKLRQALRKFLPSRTLAHSKNYISIKSHPIHCTMCLEKSKKKSKILSIKGVKKPRKKNVLLKNSPQQQDVE